MLSKLREQAWFVSFSYILLMIVMGGRTALFVAQFDALPKLFGTQFTVFGILLAVALAIAVPGGAYYQSKSVRGSGTHRIATFVMVLAALTDGAFNISEAIMLATKANAFGEYSGFVYWWLWFTVLLLGIAPTLLTIGLASLAGSVAKSNERSTARTRTRIDLSIERTTEENPALEAHWNTIDRRLSPGDIFNRSQIEQWTGIRKGQAINIIKYGRSRGYLVRVDKSNYSYQGLEVAQ